MTPIEHRYNVREGKHMKLRDVTSDEVRDYFKRIDNIHNAFVEVWKVVKPCCRDEDEYLGSFPADKVFLPT